MFVYNVYWSGPVALVIVLVGILYDTMNNTINNNPQAYCFSSAHIPLIIFKFKFALNSFQFRVSYSILSYLLCDYNLYPVLQPFWIFLQSYVIAHKSFISPISLPVSYLIA